MAGKCLVLSVIRHIFEALDENFERGVWGHMDRRELTERRENAPPRVVMRRKCQLGSQEKLEDGLKITAPSIIRAIDGRQTFR